MNPNENKLPEAEPIQPLKSSAQNQDTVNKSPTSEPVSTISNETLDQSASTVPDFDQGTQITQTQPVDTPDLAPFVPDQTAAPKKGNKKLIFGILIAVIAVLVSGSSIAFAAYYSSPEKTLLDAVENGLNAKTVITKGSFVAKSKDQGELSVAFTAQSDNPNFASSLDAKVKIKTKEINIELQGAGLAAQSGDYYFKLTNTSKLLDEALKSELGKAYASQPQYAPLVAKLTAFMKKIDGRWIKVDKSDISEYSAEYKKYQACYKKVIKTFYDTPSQQKEIVNVYSKNPFLTITSTGENKTINGQDSVAYTIKTDVKKSYAFGEALEETKVVKEFKKCDSTENDDSSDYEYKPDEKEFKQQQKEADKVDVKVWISRWGHELQKVDLSYKDETTTMSGSATFDTKTKPDLKAPSKYLKAKDLAKELEEIYTQAAGVESEVQSYGTSNNDIEGKNEVSKVVSAITSYQSNNRGKIPTNADASDFAKYLSSSSGSSPIMTPSGYKIYIKENAPAGSQFTSESKTIEIWPQAECDDRGGYAISTDGARNMAVTTLLSDGQKYCLEV